MSAWAYAVVVGSVAASAAFIVGDAARRDAVYTLLWDGAFERAMTLVIGVLAALLLTLGDAPLRRAAEKGLTAFFIAICAEAHFSFTPFFLVLAVSFLINTT